MTTVERVAQAIRRNPEGLLLLGAGVALMLRNAATSGSAQPQRKRRTHAGDGLAITTALTASSTESSSWSRFGQQGQRRRG